MGGKSTPLVMYISQRAVELDPDFNQNMLGEQPEHAG